MFVFCHQVFRSKVFDSENMFVYLSVGLVIYKFIYMDMLKSVYINGPGYNKRNFMVVLLGCPCKVPSLRINSGKFEAVTFNIGEYMVV